MASSEFEFVQGNERLDWGVLVSIDVERLMKSTSVETLQRIIENIAFSRVTRDEAALFTAEHILHLFQLCQVVIQYLVYSQEVLAKMNVRLNDRMAAQQAAVQEREVMLQRLSEENSSLKKQVKTQRRTLLAYEYNAQAALARGGGGGAPTAPAYACPYCGEVYQKAESMQSHLRKRHNTSSSAAAAPSVPSAWSDGAGLPVPAAVSSPSPPPPAPTSYAQLPQQSYYQPPPPQVSSAEELAALPQLRHRVEQLEKDKEVMERQQRENLILMMLGATRSQPTTTPPPPPPPSPAAAPATASALPSAFAPSPSSSPLPGLASSSPASPSLAEQLQGIPVVPDVSAMMNYNLSCQRESSENALRRQLVDLEAEIRALRTSNAAAVAPGTTTPAAAAAGTEPTVPRPPWVAELQQAQHPTTTITTPSLTPVPVVPALSVPASPPPTPLPPAPASAAVPPTHAYDYTSGITVNVPAPISPPQLPSPLSGLQAPPVMSPLPPPAPSVAAAETPLSVPRFDTQQQQQPPAPLSSLLPRPVPLPGVPGSNLPLPQQQQQQQPVTVAVAVPSTPEKKKHAHATAHHWASDSSSSLSSASTVPPNRVVSRGTDAGPGQGLVPGLPSPVFSAGSSSSAGIAPPPIPTPSSSAAAAATTATYPAPLVTPPSTTPSATSVVGSYFAKRSTATAPPLSLSPPLPIPTAGPAVSTTATTTAATTTIVPRPGTSNSTTSTESNSTNPYIQRHPPPPALASAPPLLLSTPAAALSVKPPTTTSLSPVPVPQSSSSSSSGRSNLPLSAAPTFASNTLSTPYISPAPALSSAIPVPSLGGVAGTSRPAAPLIPVPSSTPYAPVPFTAVPTVGGGAAPPTPLSATARPSASATGGEIRPYRQVGSSSSSSSSASRFSLGGSYEY